MRARELTGLSPSGDEVLWARSVARSDAHLLAIILSLKCFQRLGYFPRRGDVPDVVTEHMRRCLDLAEDLQPEVGSERTGTSQHQLVRERVGVACPTPAPEAPGRGSSGMRTDPMSRFGGTRQGQ